MKNPLCVLVGLLTFAPLARAETAASDPRAVSIADQVIDALGGNKRWNALVGLRWSFDVMINDTLRSTRRHSWNKHSGWHRVDGKTRDQIPYRMVHNLDGSSGSARMGSNRLEGDTLKKVLARAKSLWTNDTYWMLMPYKLRDPGVVLKYEGEVVNGNIVYDKLVMSFENVGETPGDRYWVYVNRANHRIERWDHLLQGEKPPAKTYTWEGWEKHGGLWFPTAHRGEGGRVIYTRAIETVDSFPPDEFAP
jgi:hypothetical protein